MTVLKIDLDQRRRPDVRPICRILSALTLTPFSLEVRRSSHHWHVVVWVPNAKLARADVVAVQLLCGSDPHRELYNLYRALAPDAPPYWRERWNVLFQRGKICTIRPRGTR